MVQVGLDFWLLLTTETSIHPSMGGPGSLAREIYHDDPEMMKDMLGFLPRDEQDRGSESK